MDAELTGFIRAGRDHPSRLRVASNDNRFSLHPGPVPLFDGGIEGIHIDMDYFVDGRHLLKILIPEGLKPISRDRGGLLKTIFFASSGFFNIQAIPG